MYRAGCLSVAQAGGRGDGLGGGAGAAGLVLRGGSAAWSPGPSVSMRDKMELGPSPGKIKNRSGGASSASSLRGELYQLARITRISARINKSIPGGPPSCVRLEFPFQSAAFLRGCILSLYSLFPALWRGLFYFRGGPSLERRRFVRRSARVRRAVVLFGLPGRLLQLGGAGLSPFDNTL